MIKIFLSLLISASALANPLDSDKLQYISVGTTLNLHSPINIPGNMKVRDYTLDLNDSVQFFSCLVHPLNVTENDREFTTPLIVNEVSVVSDDLVEFVEIRLDSKDLPLITCDLNLKPNHKWGWEDYSVKIGDFKRLFKNIFTVTY